MPNKHRILGDYAGEDTRSNKLPRSFKIAMAIVGLVVIGAIIVRFAR